MASDLPFVRVVVLNFDGWQMTIDCLRSVLATDWPADRLEVVLVDNGSVDDVVARVRAELPAVRIIEPLANTGFAGGCNLGIRAPGEFDVVALVNNDATVDPGWLRPLVAALWTTRPGRRGVPEDAVRGPLRRGRARGPRRRARSAGDPRTLGRADQRRPRRRRAGRRAAGVRRGVLRRGGAGSRADGEELARWSWRRGHVRRPGRRRRRARRGLALRVAAPAPRADRHGRTAAAIDRDGRSAAADPCGSTSPSTATAFDVINNAGSSLYPDGFGGDRGFLERDRGQYDEPAEVFAWCGGAVLLSKAYLDDVGLFDERLFLYYEDTDLSWRGRLRGWRYVYVPTLAGAPPPRRVARRRLEGVPVLHRAQPAAGAGQERAGRAGVAARASGVVKRGVGVTVRDLVSVP